MKKLILGLTTLLSLQSFAASIECTSKSYKLTANNKAEWTANYSIKGVENDGADVMIGKRYVSKNFLILFLEVDGQEDKFKAVAYREKVTDQFEGEINDGNKLEKAKCNYKD